MAASSAVFQRAVTADAAKETVSPFQVGRGISWDTPALVDRSPNLRRVRIEYTHDSSADRATPTSGFPSFLRNETGGPGKRLRRLRAGYHRIGRPKPSPVPQSSRWPVVSHRFIHRLGSHPTALLVEGAPLVLLVYQGKPHGCASADRVGIPRDPPPSTELSTGRSDSVVDGWRRLDSPGG